MNFRKYLGLIVGCGVALLAAIGAGVLLFFALSNHGKAQDALKTEQGKLEQLNKRKPFPIQANVEQSQAKLNILNAELSNTFARLAKGQVELDKIEPAEFAPLLERTINQLRREASNNVVQLPNAFAFGFDRYSAGDIPSSNNVPRLVLQLKSMARLCDVFFAAKVSNITAVVREEFETGAAAAGGAARMGGLGMFAQGEFAGAPAGGGLASAKDVPAAASNELFAAERFQVSVSGRENSIWEVLNALVSGPLFTVIRDVQMDSVTAGIKVDPAATRPGMPPPAAMNMGGMERMLAGVPPGMAGLGQSPQMVATNALFPPREERVIAGRESVRMTLVVDVYRFAAAKEEAK